MRDLKGREGEEEEGEGRQEGREGCWSANDQIVQVLMLACSLLLLHPEPGLASTEFAPLTRKYHVCFRA